ncbi:secretory subunit [Blastocladiella emersonii ATCC 22665]|nr:secretory subunit [Blastocladiella emersonii ATCC 22665]
MTQYSYDDTGVFFAYFVLTVALLVLVPATYKWVMAGSRSFRDTYACTCDLCKRKHKANRKKEAKNHRVSNFAKLIALGAGWAAVIFAAYHISVTELDTPVSWDPWNVLGIATSATRSEIRKAYHKLSLEMHPDKVAPELKEKANSIFADISKAYKVLTNAEARKNFEDWGHPDGKQSFSMGIALPTFMVGSTSAPAVLAGYFIAFGVLLPYALHTWWSKTRNYTKDNVHTRSMGILFKRTREDGGLKSILNNLAHAQELAEECPHRGAADDKHLAELEPQVAAAFEALGETWDPKEDLKPATTPTARKALVHLLAHFTRPKGYTASADAQRAVVKAAHLLHRGVLQITLARGWLIPSLYAMDLSQLLAQGVWHSRSPLFQVPHATVDLVKQCATRDPPVRSLQDLALLDDADRRAIFKGLKNDQYADVTAFLHAFPRIVLEKLDFKVVGEPNITPGSLVTCTIRLRLVSITVPLDSLNAEYEAKKAARAAKIEAGEPVSDDEEDVDALGLDGEGDGGRGTAAKVDLASKVKFSHAPRFPADKRPGWWVFIGNLESNRVITASRIPDHSEAKKKGAKGGDDSDRFTVKLQFQAPGQVGVYPFSVFLKSDHWVGADMRLDIQMKVEPPLADRVVEEEDDISDPEEDTIAGQMAILRGQRVKPAAGYAPDSGVNAGAGSDSDSSSSSDEDE